jgi:hypothetical protein
MASPEAIQANGNSLLSRGVGWQVTLEARRVDLSFPRNFVFQASMDRIGEMEGWNVRRLR